MWIVLHLGTSRGVLSAVPRYSLTTLAPWTSTVSYIDRPKSLAMPLPASPRYSTLELAKDDTTSRAPELDHAIVAPENDRQGEALQVRHPPPAHARLKQARQRLSRTRRYPSAIFPQKLSPRLNTSPLPILAILRHLRWYAYRVLALLSYPLFSLQSLSGWQSG